MGYTGNSAIYFNDQPQPENAEKTYRIPKQLDAEKGLAWLDATDNNNTYALAMRENDAETRGIATMSDLAEALNAGEELVLASNTEFYARDDGLPPLQ